jgi:hypothetical protein
LKEAKKAEPSLLLQNDRKGTFTLHGNSITEFVSAQILVSTFARKTMYSRENFQVQVKPGYSVVELRRPSHFPKRVNCQDFSRGSSISVLLVLGPLGATHKVVWTIELRRLIRLRRYSAKRILAEKRRNSGGPKTSVPKFGMGWSPPVPYDPLRRLGAHGHMSYATCGAMIELNAAKNCEIDILRAE